MTFTTFGCGVFVLLAVAADADEFVVKAKRNVADRKRFDSRMMGLAPNLRRTWVIPGLFSSYVPQGIAVQGNLAVLSYYTKSRIKSDASVLVLVDLETGKVKTWARLRDAKNKFVHDHVGGVAVIGDHIYTGAGGRVRRFSLKALAKTRRGRSLAELGQFLVDSRMSNLSAEGARLWIGEYRNRGYPTARHHRHGSLRAWAVAYDIDRETGEPIGAGSDSRNQEPLRPAIAVFTPDRVQGIAKHRDIFVLSISNGNTGWLKFYRSPLDDAPVAGHSFPAHPLRDPFLTLTIPAGAEDLSVSGGSLYVTFESACHTYRHWRRRGAYLEDRYYELAIPRPVEESHAPLLERTRFSIDSKKTRTLRFKFVVPGAHDVKSSVRVGIGDAADNVGDRGLYLELVDSKGVVAFRGFVAGKEIVWSDHELSGGAWELRLVDRDTEFESKWPGNAGTVEIWIQK